ncbi:MAG: hypothetical protein L0H84_05110 [Pseudonocardia sp.]|nr:hypothetical protein [Pseudonocardia sp.]
MVRTRMSAPRWAGVVTMLSIAALALISCGAPEWTYVTNTDERTYAKVPVTWNDVSNGLDPPGAILGLSADHLSWVRVFDAAPQPSIEHVTGTAAAGSPTMVLLVLNLPAQARGKVGFDFLRDMVLPVSVQSRSILAAQPMSPLGDFKLYDDQTLTPGNGLRGVRTVYSYSLGGGPPQVFDQTAYANDDASKVYLITIRCSLDCYKQNADQINDVASSFTVREQL